MKYAVVQLAGKQYKVSEGDKLSTNRLSHAEGAEFTSNDVLFVTDGKKTEVGLPLVKDAKVKFKVVAHEKSDKLRVATYHAKSRYRRVRGHRQHESLVEVVSIG